MQGTVGPSSLLAQRAVADDPRWTRAVEDNPTIPLPDFPIHEGVEAKEGDKRSSLCARRTRTIKRCSQG